MHHWWFVLPALGAALAFGTSSHLKHLSAGEIPAARTLRPAALGRLTRASLTHRLWLAGIAADAVGLGLQLTALHAGPLAAVQPLLALALVFALLLRQRHRGRVQLAQIGWAALVAAALAGLLALLGATGDRAARAQAGPALGAAVAGSFLVVCCVLYAKFRSGALRSAASLGIALGTIYATTAALLKTLTTVAAADPASVLWHWQLYVVIALGAGGLVLNQLAFQAGPLTASLPSSSAADPLVSIAIGVFAFGEPVHHGALSGIAFALLLAALTTGIVALARTHPPPDHHERPKSRQPALRA